MQVCVKTKRIPNLELVCSMTEILVCERDDTPYLDLELQKFDILDCLFKHGANINLS